MNLADNDIISFLSTLTSIEQEASLSFHLTSNILYWQNVRDHKIIVGYYLGKDKN